METDAGPAGMPGAGTQRQVVTVGGHRLTLTHLDKVMYPLAGMAKADVLGYYASVADVLIRHTRDRPATRKRWVHGVGTPDEPGQVFFQKNLGAGTPEWVPRRLLTHTDRPNAYPLVNDLATLTWLAQIGTLEIHVPQWRFDVRGEPMPPDRLVLDLDPGEGVGLPECAQVARWARAILLDMGLESTPVTSGSKGIHLYCALDGSHTAEQVSQVAHELARALEADHPGEVLSAMTRSLRPGKVFVDWSQNSASKTTIAPYSLRGLFRPMVAAPRTWRELESPDLEQLDFRQVLHRLDRRPDPLASVAAAAESSGSAHTGDLARAGGRQISEDRLREYRDKRDALRTPEPMPVPDAGAGAGSPGSAFVIQEHHARALHFDLRLERDGVLMSWALPKGVPTDPTRNHLAVQTEDHPLEYLTFQGDIPAGEYGAGTMAIWDSGSYSARKWRDDEIIVTLHGRPDGGLAGHENEFALIRTGGEGTRNWLIHLMKPTRLAPGEDAPEPAEPTRRPRPHQPTQPTGEAAEPAPHSPMLARAGAVRDLSPDTDWAFEMKWDGIRALAYLGQGPGGAVRLLTRNGNDVTASFPDLIADVRAAVRRGQAVSGSSAPAGTVLDGTVLDGTVLDGEIVALDRRNRPDFSLLQNRLGLTEKGDVRRAAREVPVHYLVFDILQDTGRNVTDLPYSQRRELLAARVADTGTVQVPPAFTGDAAAAMTASAELGLEGVVAKDRDSRYLGGKRTGLWVKIKHVRAQEVVIGGWRPGAGHRDQTFGSLLVGIPVAPATGAGTHGSPHGGAPSVEAGHTPVTLSYAGRVGTGFSDRDLAVLRQRLDTLRSPAPPFEEVPEADAAGVTWVAPTLVGEVEFSGWTPAGRLRHPTWRGLRPDKSAEDVVREPDVFAREENAGDDRTRQQRTSTKEQRSREQRSREESTA